MKNLLADLRVVELASVLAGPLVGSFFAELGAEVTKVEAPDGDVTRRWRTEGERDESQESAYFCAANFGKKHLKLNLKNEDDYRVLSALVKDADIVISNYLPKVARKLKTSYADLVVINPAIIYCELGGFVEDENRAAYDAVMQAETGWMGMNGTPPSGPLKIPVAVMDIFASHHMKEAILLALIKRMKGGGGSHIRCYLEASSVSNLANQASNFLMNGREGKLEGSLHPNIAPYGEVFWSSDDKQVVLAVGSDRQFEGLCEILGLTGLTTEFSSNSIRVKNRSELARFLAVAIAKIDAETLISKAKVKKIPLGIIQPISKVLKSPWIATWVLEDGSGKRMSALPFEWR